MRLAWPQMDADHRERMTNVWHEQALGTPDDQRRFDQGGYEILRDPAEIMGMFREIGLAVT